MAPFGITSTEIDPVAGKATMKRTHD